jgi:hypothetical protein
MFARAALLLLLTIGFVRLSAAEPDELASLRAKAERGNALAQYNLGLAYSQGRLTSPDLAEAFAWLTLASENGATGKALDSLLGNISDEQLAEGRRRLRTYRTAVSAKATPLTTHTPKLAPRGFKVEDPPPTPPVIEATAPAPKAPEAVTPTITTTPTEGAGAAELTQMRRDLAKAQADLINANNELATLRASIARLEAATAEAKATEARLLTELKAVRPEAVTPKPATLPATAEKTTPENPPSHQP